MNDDAAVIAEWLEFFAVLNEDPYFPPYLPACSRSWKFAGESSNVKRIAKEETR